MDFDGVFGEDWWYEEDQDLGLENMGTEDGGEGLWERGHGTGGSVVEYTYELNVKREGLTSLLFRVPRSSGFWVTSKVLG